jgi:hypothetical protein
MFQSPAVKSVLVAGVLTFLGAAALVACGSSSSGSSATPDAGSDADTTVDGNVGPTDASTGDGAVQPLTWTWVSVPGAKCRDGSATGIGVNLSPGSTKTVIFMEGGGACFNSFTCDQNPSKFGEAEFTAGVAGGGPAGASGGGILARGNAKNPVKDWNMIYVPYCTGDIHGGDNPAGMVPGVAGTQLFVGRNNVKVDLEKVKTLIPTTTEVFLTGASGGGFGAAVAYDQVATFYGQVPVTMIDDSGPPMADPYLPSCLQTLVANLWGLEKTVIADCGDDCKTDGGAIDTAHWGINSIKHLAKKYPDRRIGLVESTGDLTISSFFGFGSKNCSALDPVLEPDFTAGLLDIRAQMASDTNFGTFYFKSQDHTSYEDKFDSRMSTSTMDGGAPVSLQDWTTQMLSGTVTNVGP